MKSKILWALVGLNVLLLASLFTSRMGESTAHAQAGGRPIDFIMIPAEASGLPTGIVYIIDTSTGQLGGFAYEDSRKQLNVMPPIDLSRALQGAGAGTGTDNNRGGGGGGGTRRN